LSFCPPILLRFGHSAEGLKADDNKNEYFLYELFLMRLMVMRSQHIEVRSGIEIKLIPLTQGYCHYLHSV